MNPTATAHRAECLQGNRATETIPVTQLRPGDLVFDIQGDLHALVSAERGSAGSMWIQRHDLNHVEHLVGRIMVVRSRTNASTPA